MSAIPDPVPPSDPVPDLHAGALAGAVDSAGFDPGMFPARRRTFGRLLMDHNPFLLLSAVLMLLGCYLINSSIDARGGDLFKLLTLLLAVNIYEVCIIGLGLVLIRRTRGTARDGLWLLLFEALFLVNGTFLNVDPELFGGWHINFVLFVLAIVKSALIFRGLGIGLGRTFGFIAAELTIIYGLPILFWHVSVDGVVAPRVMYGLYWLVGLLPVAYDLLERVRPSADRARWDLVQQVVRRTYLIAPWLLLVAHLGFSHWAHHSTFAMADIGPLLLGVTVAATVVRLPMPLDVWCRLLPAAAFVFSIGAPDALIWPTPIPHVLPTVTPALLAGACALLTYGYLVSLWAAAGMMVAIVLGLGVYAVQDWVGAVLRTMGKAIEAIVRSLWVMIPTTATSWGFVALVGAFVMLALGALLSLRRTRPSA